MKNKLSLTKKIKRTISLFSTLFIFTSCENFMQSLDIQQNINAIIDYAHAAEVQVIIKNETHSSVTPSGAVTAKVGYPVEILCTTENGYYFDIWQAFDEDGNLLTEDDVKFDNNTELKTKVTVCKKIKGITISCKILENPALRFTLSCNLGTGVLSNTQPQKLDIGETFEIEFTEAKEYQFVKWEVPGDCVSINDIYKKSAKIKAEKDGDVVIKAVTAERPAVASASTKNISSAVSKNTSTNITFNYPLSAETDLSKIKVYIGDLQTGFGENKPFLAPQFGSDKKTVIIPANQNPDYYIDVEAGNTKQITIVIPSDLYYKLDDATEEREATKVTVGGEGISWSYEVNDKTNENTKITVNPSTSLGTLTAGSTGEYSIGKEIIFKYALNENAQFIKWNVAAADGTVSYNQESDGNVQILTVKTLRQGDVSIATEVYERPTFTESTISPANENTGVNLDSDFKVTFTQKLDKAAIEEAAIISVDGLALGGKSSSNQYFTPVFDENTKTFTFASPAESTKIIELRNLLAIDSGKTKTITVKIPAAAIYYKTNSSDVIASKTDVNYSYRVKDETSKKANVKFVFTNGTLKLNEASVNTGTTFAYSLGDKISLNYEISGGYKFEGWEAVDASSKTVENILQIEDSTVPETFVTVLSEIDNAVFTAKTNQRPVVTSFEPANVSAGVSEDSQIQIKFTMPMDASTFDYDIFVDDSKTDETASKLSFKDAYFGKPIFTDGNKTVTIKVAAGKLINMTGYPLREVKIELKDTVKSESGVTLAQSDLTHSYKINSSKDASEPRFDSITIKRGWDNGTITDKVYTDWEDADYKSNHAASLHIVCKGADAGQGLQKIELKQKLIKKVDGTEVNKDLPSIFAEGFTLDEGTLDQYTFDKVVKFDPEETDGLVQVEVYIYDGNGNKVKAGDKCWYFIKDTKVNTVGIGIDNSIYMNRDEWKTDEGFINMNDCFTTWYVNKGGFPDDVWWQGDGKEFTSEKENFILTLRWGKNSEDYHESKIDEKNSSDEYYVFNMDNYEEEFSREVSLVIQDEAGAIGMRSEIIPKKMKPLSMRKIGNDKYEIILSQDLHYDGISIGYRVFYEAKDGWKSNQYGLYQELTSKIITFYLSLDDDENTGKIVINSYHGKNAWGTLSDVIDLKELVIESGEGDFAYPNITENDIEIISMGPSTGKYQISVKVNEETGVKYLYKLFTVGSGGRSKSIKEVSEENTWITSIYNTNLKCEVVATDGKFVKESETPVELVLPDNQPLKWNSAIGVDSRPFVYSKDGKFMDMYSASISKLPSNKKEYEYQLHYADYKPEWDNNPNPFSIEEIKELKHFTVTGNTDEYGSMKNLHLPIFGLPDGNIGIFVDIEDDNENPNYYIGGIGNIEVRSLSNLTYKGLSITKGDGMRDHLRLSFEANEKLTNGYKVGHYWAYKNVDNKWVCNQISGDYTNDNISIDSGETDLFDYHVRTEWEEDMDIINECFIKVVCSFGSSFEDKSMIYSVPIYAYVNKGWITAGDHGYDFACAIDNVSQIPVICSSYNPALVHTLCISDNFNYNTDVEQWERRGIEVHNEVYTKNANYIIDDSEVPSMSNYVVVAHFADGSTFISSVHHKD